MKTWKLLMTLVLASAVTMGCSEKKEDSVTVIDPRGGSTAAKDPVLVGEAVGGAVTSLPNTGYLKDTYGEVITDQRYQDSFQKAVDYFVSVNLNPETDLGTVSASSGDSTGVRIQGYIETVKDANSATNGTINATKSKLQVAVWDSYIEETKNSAEPVPAYIRNFQAVSGSINGNAVQIVLQDEFGQVTLEGNFTAQWFTGSFKFANSKSYSPDVPARSATMGSFIVKTCGFFNCIH